MTPDAIIDGLGGTVAVAAGLELDKTSVSKWRRNGIPPGRWLSLVKFAERQGRSDLTLEILASIKAPTAEAAQ
jgi:hypothetical protein